MSTLPNWVYDLVGELLREEDEHPKLFFTSGAFEGYRQYEWCALNALNLVPADVREQADVIAEYRRQAEKDKQPAPGEES